MARSFAAGVGVAGMTTGCTATFRAGALCLTAGAGSPSKQAQPANTIANPTNAIRTLLSPHEQGAHCNTRARICVGRAKSGSGVMRG